MTDFLISRTNPNASAFNNTSYEVRPVSADGRRVWREAMGMDGAVASIIPASQVGRLTATFDDCMVRYRLA